MTLANPTLEDPRVNFAISTRGSKPGVDHLGLQADDAEDLAELKERAAQADLALLDVGETSCCYARSDKYWVTDPQGVAWEHFQTLGDIPVYSQAEPRPAAAEAGEETGAEAGACCAGAAPRGKPIAIPVTSKKACC